MKKNSDSLVKAIVWGVVIAIVLFVVLPTLFAVVEFALSVLVSLVMIAFFLGLGFVLYRTFTKE